MSLICLVRHGETNWNILGKVQGREDIELNENGKKQALISSSLLKNYNWDMIASSPLKRAYTTAEIIASCLDLPSIILIDDFVERDFGEASGLTPAERKTKYLNKKIFGEESFDELKTRVITALNNTALKYKDKNIIIVSHGGVINCILNVLSHGSIGSGKTFLNNGCLNLLNYENGNWHIKGYNITPEKEDEAS